VWLDRVDAEPGRSLKRLAPADIKKLDQKWGLGKRAKPTSAAAVPPKAAPPEAEAPATPPPAVAPPKRKRRTKAEIRAEAEAKAEDDKPAGPDYSAKECSKDEAYAALVHMKVDTVTDDMVNEAWLGAIDAVVGEEGDDADLAPKQWAGIRDDALTKFDNIPF